jgi:hypothetical protein
LLHPDASGFADEARVVEDVRNRAYRYSRGLGDVPNAGRPGKVDLRVGRWDHVNSFGLHFWFQGSFVPILLLASI